MTAIPDYGPRPVDPVAPVAPWLGGKSRLAKRLCAMIEAVPHRLYAEPFVGMGGVFFRRTFQRPVEVINDKRRACSSMTAYRCPTVRGSLGGGPSSAKRYWCPVLP